ncbi:MAG: DNA repair protein RadC [Prevotella sp.]|jgi:DNA repair protein RadC|nr:DNA repair protein RadC [Prevotella sp.]MCR5151812.1 DNA repair protein RadC [Prevotella sp.]
MNDERTITQWELSDRPRERMDRLGAEALTNAEILAILIGSGSPGESAVKLMQRILNDCDNKLYNLGRLTTADLMEYHGIGLAKAITILAACELGRRRALEKVEQTFLANSVDIYNYMHERMNAKDASTEEAWIVMMNSKFKLISAKRISQGGLSDTLVDVRVILREALINKATIITLCHNHPSNNPKPSKEDDRLTESVKKACEIMRIFFADHIIITDGDYYSYRDYGRL